ncbi:MAG: hypothetical protein F8N15_09845 [Methanobacterium sp.]|nr:hypothetical protein [Methanobacterium sp.]
MITHPIYVKRISYRGTNARKRSKVAEQNRIAAALEAHINKLLLEQTAPICSYLYHDIASATGYSVEQVRDLCFSIDGGHNGFTAIKPGLSYDEAIATISQ